MDRKLLILGGIFILTFLSFMSVLFLNDPIGRFTRAANPNSQPSQATSLVFAWPLSIPADGTTKSDISVFICDANGKGLEGKSVRVTSSIGIINKTSALTDTNGKAIFSLTSTTKGIANIEAFVDNTKLLKSITVQLK